MVHPLGVEPRIAGYKPGATNRISLGCKNGAPRETRTHTSSVLSRFPLPIGVGEHKQSRQSYLANKKWSYVKLLFLSKVYGSPRET